ncbi:MAG: HAD-IB family phosphatase [Desulfurococcales archaeon]|nr:HAD-IB family phosphatase [Desulfurococcales archaeon]
MTRRVKIVLFDMDGVLANIPSSWEYLHEYFGVKEEARKIMKEYEEGKFDYIEWMRRDTSLWLKKKDKIHITELIEAFEKVELNPDIERVGIELHRRGIIIGIVSGGIDLLTRRVAKAIGADVWAANKLQFDKKGYLLPGGVPVVGVDKTATVRRILAEFSIPPSQSMFVGDSRWDATAMRIVGYPVAYGDKCDYLTSVVKCRIHRLIEVVELVDEIEKTGDCPSFRV